ncbi:DegV family protein [Clostridium sp.]|jgi:DegV family protein with EDD domain|uniref:DegV family protein n=1 Tax=Clostridium sp. TaxID=1506 RepID=UPI0039F44F29
MAIKIITDSGCDLPRDIIEEYNIEVLPLFVYAEGNEYLDGESIQPEELYNNMREGTIYTTSQVPPSKFKDVFIKHAENKDEVIYIGFSSQLTGTYQSAIIAKEEVLETYPDFKIYTIDTKCASLGLGLVVYKAAKMAKEGKNKDEIIKSIEFNSEHMEHIFTVDDLEYLLRGGRVSRAAAMIGGILNIKPVLDVEDGKLMPKEKVRGRKKALKRIVEIAGERGVDLKEQIIGISHGDDMEAVEVIKRMLEENFGCNKFIINMVGCVIGAHSGPGTLALFFLNEKE